MSGPSWNTSGTRDSERPYGKSGISGSPGCTGTFSLCALKPTVSKERAKDNKNFFIVINVFLVIQI